jgi:hypothetical protein
LFENFDNAHDQKMMSTGKPLQNSRVRERLMRQISSSKKSRDESGPEILTKKPHGEDSGSATGSMHQDF